MAERRTLYSGYATDEVADPREGDMFITPGGEVLYYISCCWAKYPATDNDTEKWLTVAQQLFTINNLYEMQARMLTMTDEMHNALALFASYLVDENDASEVKQDFQMYRAQRKLSGAS